MSVLHKNDSFNLTIFTERIFEFFLSNIVRQVTNIQFESSGWRWPSSGWVRRRAASSRWPSSGGSWWFSSRRETPSLRGSRSARTRGRAIPLFLFRAFCDGESWEIKILTVLNQQGSLERMNWLDLGDICPIHSEWVNVKCSIHWIKSDGPFNVYAENGMVPSNTFIDWVFRVLDLSDRSPQRVIFERMNNSKWLGLDSFRRVEATKQKSIACWVFVGQSGNS